MSRLELIVDARADLAEGPVWRAATGELIWVDLDVGRVHILTYASGLDRAHDVGRPVGVAVPRATGGLMLAVQEGFAALDLDTGKTSLLVPVEADRPQNRMNDGACDAAGRLWAGTMALDARPRAGSLYRLDQDLRVTTVLTELTISNGIGWSPDGGTMYYVDSPTYRIDAFDYDTATGAATGRRTLARIEPQNGLPDGLAVDAEGAIWLALWGGSAVRRYAPDGTLVAVVEVPASQVTSCAFGGPTLDTLFITTARLGLSALDLEDEVGAGGIFALDAGVRGVDDAAFGGPLCPSPDP